MNQEQKTALEKVLELRKYTHESGMLTTRAQKAELQKLDPADLADVLIALRQHQQQVGW